MTTQARHILIRNLLEEVDPNLTPEESLAVRAVAHHETKYGEAWPEGHGKGSFNMGAIMTGESSSECTGFTHKDSNPEREFTGCFRIYRTPEEGFQHLVKVLLKPNVRHAASTGDLYDVAKAMFDNSYYTGTSKDPNVNIARYHTALRRNLDEILKATGETDPFLGETTLV